MPKTLDNNLRIYPWLQFSSGFMAWIPVFILYFLQRVSWVEAIQLGAVYYIFVCIGEVPSGYFSDRMGRRLTLIMATTASLLSYGVLIFATDFSSLLVGQGLLAIGVAMKSGTDNALLYDTLLSLKRAEAYAKHEARGSQYSTIAAAIAVLLGGALALLDLRLAYVLSFVSAFVAVWLAWHIKEPIKHHLDQANHGFLSTLRSCLFALGSRTLCWIMCAMILVYALTHVLFEFYQPYLTLLNLDISGLDAAPLLSGLIISISFFIATLGAMMSISAYEKLGIIKLMALALAMQLLIIGGLATVLSYWVVALVCFRNFSMTLLHAPVLDVIGQRIPSSIRATYLSLQSLSERLMFSVLLLGLTRLVDDTKQLQWFDLSRVFCVTAIIGALGLVLIVYFSPTQLRASTKQ